MNFTKMNGLGNDYIFIDGTNEILNFSPSLISKLCDRHFGIGGDGIIVVEESKIADLKMLVYNADGSRAEMCGNALRCLAKFALRNHLAQDMYLKIETDGGLFYVKYDGTKVTANMGTPVLSLEKKYLDNNKSIFGYEVKVGNPHFVIFAKNYDDLFEKYASDISNNLYMFPERINVEFADVNSNENLVKLRVYERGTGETLACGTGATATFEVAFRQGLLKDDAKLALPGGILTCSHNSKGEVLVTGAAEINYVGEVDLTNYI